MPYERPSAEGIERFAELAGSTGIPVTIRYSRGLDIDAACGQLRSKQLQGKGSVEAFTDVTETEAVG